MPPLSFDALAAQAKKGQFLPLYLIVGDDEVEKDAAAALFVAAVPADVQAFALERFSALETDPGDVVAAARTLTFLGDRRFLIVTRAEKWLTGKRKARDGGDGEAESAAETDDTATSGSVELLERYVESPEPASTLVLVAADVNRTTRLAKALVKQAAIVECWGLKDEKELRGFAINDALQRAARFVVQTLKASHLTIDRHALQPLLEHAGTDIATLRGDVERLVLYCHGKSSVSLDDVKAIVSGTALVNRWGIVNAVERGDAREALRQVALAIDNGEVPFMILGQIAWFVRNKLPAAAPGRVPAAVDALFRADVAMKSSGGEARVLLERLVVELCPARAGVPSRSPRR